MRQRQKKMTPKYVIKNEPMHQPISEIWHSKYIHKANICIGKQIIKHLFFVCWRII